jgi:hypothetical protein
MDYDSIRIGEESRSLFSDFPAAGVTRTARRETECRNGGKPDIIRVLDGPEQGG